MITRCMMAARPPDWITIAKQPNGCRYPGLLEMEGRQRYVLATSTVIDPIYIRTSRSFEEVEAMQATSFGYASLKVIMAKTVSKC